MPINGYRNLNLRIEDAELLGRIENKILFHLPPSIRVVRADLFHEALLLLAKKYEVQ